MNACHIKENVDLIVFNARVYTIDSQFSIQQSFAVRDSRFVSVGSNEEIRRKYSSDNMVDMKGLFIYPGFIDAHCHFYGYGKSLERVDLRDTKSFDEVVKKVYEYAKSCKSEWIIGRGWDQNDWPKKAFPNNEPINKLFPDRPVILYRVDGHAAIVNSEAFKRAGITSKIKVDGGQFIFSNNELTGVIIDNAIDLVTKAIPSMTNDEIATALLKAQQNCFAVGLTSVHDAGLDVKIIRIIDSLQKSGKLTMRMYCMLDPNDESKQFILKTKKYQTDFLNVRSVKLYADGALGSRGACLCEPYTDQPGHYGTILYPLSYYEEWCKFAADNDIQVCTHAIGDSANRMMLALYEKYLKGKENSRWRIEHFQVVNPADLKLPGKDMIIPSVQPTHATSDMYWAEQRLGPERIKFAYSYKDLLNTYGWVALGSDFPVENINPLYGFYAAVSRKDQKGWPEQGFMKEQALTREEALKGMTIWAAKAAFEENLKGSIEPGKYADFVVLPQDIMTIPEDQLFKVMIAETYIAGKNVFTNSRK